MKRLRKNRSGFTLMELVVVLMIIGVLAAIVVPAFLRSTQISRQNACINNLRLIEQATDQAAEELGMSAGQTPAKTTVDSYIKSGAPVCPTNGTYTYPAVGSTASCSVHGTIASPRMG